MGFNSQAGQVGVGIQSVKGTPVAATRFPRIKSGSLAAKRDLLIPDPEIGGGRDVTQAYLGSVSYAGEYSFYPRMEMLAMLMYAVLGAKSSSSSAGQNEVQSIAITGTPTGGTFTLTYRGQTTSALNYNATASEVDAALGALSLIGSASNILSAGGPLPGTPITVTFNAGAVAAYNAPLMTATSSLTGGTNPSIAITTTTPGYAVMGVHVLSPANTSPWLTIEERYGTSLGSFQYSDCKVNSLKLEVNANQYLMGSASIIALTTLEGFTAQTSPPWDETPMMVADQVVVSFGGATLPAKGMTFEIMNNIEDDDYRLGSYSLADLVEKRREVKMTFTVRPDDLTMWKAATFGDSTLHVPTSGPAYQGAVTIQVDAHENIQGTSTPYRLLISIPAAVMAPFKIEPSGDDIIQNDIEVQAIQPDSQVPILTCTIRNDLASVV